MFTIEELSLDNLSDIAAMAFKIWPEESYQEELNYYQGAIDDPKVSAFLIRDGEVPIGFVHVSLRTDHVEGTSTSPVCYVEGIYVEPDYRRKGVAIKLIQQAEGWGRSQGCTEIASDVEIGNEQSIMFHEKAGFEEANRVVCYSKQITGI